MPPVWSTACPDWERRIVAGESLVPVAPLFPDEAQAAMAVLDSLRVVDVAGSPTFGESSRPWMREFAAAIFGAYDPETGRRLIREFFLLISKKNGKSTLAAAIMLTALIRNWRNSAEFYILAPTKEIANNSFVPIRDMIRADDALDALIHVKENERTFVHRGTKAILKVIAADSDTVGGKKGVGVLVDELWLLGKRANAGAMLMEATGGKVSRPEAFTIFLSTQSDEPPAGVFKDKLDYFRDVRDGVRPDRRSVPVLYEFPPAMRKAEAYLKPENFFVTNPNLGLIVSAEDLEEDLAKQQAAGPHALNVFLAKHLNVEIGQNLRADRWAGADVWPGAADPTLTLETLLDRSEVIVAGIDGGGLDDLLGLALMGREKGTGRWLVWARAYCHIVVLRRRKSIASELIDLAKAGELQVFDANGLIEPSALAAMVAEESAVGSRQSAVDESPPSPSPSPLAGEGRGEGAGESRGEGAVEVILPPDIRALVEVIERPLAAGLLGLVGIDQHGVGLIAEGLKTIGVWQEEADKPEPMVPLWGVSQGYKLQGAIKTVERKLDDRTLLHGGQRLLAWCVGNARTVMSGNAAMVTKAASGTAKIDPLMAVYDCAALMSTNPEPAGSVYSATRGLRSFG